MLRKLTVQNYAIIDELEIDFPDSLSVITGETGAGKSIIVGALSLILGERADNSALINKEKKCFVEGLFDVRNKQEVKKFFVQNDLEFLDELIIRREINPNGKSRAFINDSPVTLVQLSALSSMLVDLHQQFDTLQLGEAQFQREVLDALAGHNELLNSYQHVFQTWQSAKKEWEALKKRKQEFEKEFDYNQFQYNELDEAGFKENELEDIAAELKLLSHSEGIRAALSKLHHDLKESERPMIPQLRILLNQLQAFSGYHPQLPALLQRLQSVQIELQDIAEETESISLHIHYDPQKLEQLNERLSSGYKLLKKHGVKSTADLLRIHQELSQKLQSVLDIDEQLQQKEKETQKLFLEARQMASAISEGRKKQVDLFEQKVNRLLTQVGMPNARLKAEIHPAGDLNFYGFDSVEFLFNANLPSRRADRSAGQEGGSQPFQSLRKVASGGELSRLMLCIKSLVARSIDLPTLIFDEIDAGVSGEAVRQIGIIMKGLAEKRQIVCITHQPQIAGRADAHFLVYKEFLKNSAQTKIRKLSTEERITAIAKMISGEQPTAAAMANAKEMVMN